MYQLKIAKIIWLVWLIYVQHLQPLTYNSTENLMITGSFITHLSIAS